jgi:hypothetical protein
MVIEKIRKHPFYSFMIMIGAILSGLAAFTDSLENLSSFFLCFPENVGYIREYTGEAKLATVKKTYDWKKITVMKKTISTANHHCSRNCRGEPTRTNYTVQINLNELKIPKVGNRKFENPKLSCLSGPCGGWNEVMDVSILENNTKIFASLDVWSKPTTWELTADVYEYQAVLERKNEKPMQISNKRNLNLEIEKDIDYSLITGKMEDGHIFAVEVGKEDKSNTFKLLSYRKGIDFNEYIYKVIRTKCNKGENP